jgi:hypothetical protein
MKMETVILENPQTYNNSEYDEEWEVFEEWLSFDADPLLAGVWATDDNWEHLYTFQLFVREARKDE